MRKKLLLVEKDTDILHILQHIFETEGWLVNAFTSEIGVLEQIKMLMPDVIVLDVIKPTLEGTALCRQIRITEAIKDIPIVALSTHVEAGKLHSICADKVLGKPFDISEVIEAVESQLSPGID